MDFCGTFCVGPKSNYRWFRSISLTCHIEPPPFGHIPRLKISEEAGNKIGLRSDLTACERRPKTLVQPSFIHTRLLRVGLTFWQRHNDTSPPPWRTRHWQLWSAKPIFTTGNDIPCIFQKHCRKFFFQGNQPTLGLPFKCQVKFLKLQVTLKIPLACTRKSECVRGAGCTLGMFWIISQRILTWCARGEVRLNSALPSAHERQIYTHVCAVCNFPGNFWWKVALQRDYFVLRCFENMCSAGNNL